MSDTIKLLYARIKDMCIVPSNRKEYATFLEQNEGKDIRIQRVTGLRTEKQNNSLHSWCSQVAKELNEKGLTVQEVLKKTIDLDWNTYRVKDILWKSVQEALTGKKSTTQLDKTKEIDEIWEHLNRFLGQKCDGIYVPFPHEVKVEEKPIDYPTEELKPTF